MRYTFLLRPSDGMADVTVSKTVVETRVGSNPTSGTITIKELWINLDPELFFSSTFLSEYGRRL